MATPHRTIAILVIALAAPAALASSYVNFEASHVHPIDLTPSGQRLLVVNTPDATLEVFDVESDGSLVHERSIRVGLEPVTVVARTDDEAWVVNNLSDSVSIVDLDAGATIRTLAAGDEPTDVVFAANRAFVAVSQEDAIRVFSLANLNAAPTVVSLAARDVRALATSPDGSKVYAIALRSGNRTSVMNAKVNFGNNANLSNTRLTALNLRDLDCPSPGPPPYPPLPAGIARNPALVDPPPSSNPASFPPVGLIVRWDAGTSRWLDEVGSTWTHCLPHRPADRDLSIVDATTLAVTAVTGVGTSLFEVSVHPTNGRIYVPHTEARNFVRFEHALGVRGHLVDNRLAIVDPAAGHAVTLVDLNSHVNRASTPPSNAAERAASMSQPGMLVWKADGSAGYLTAIGSHKVFRVTGSCTAPGCIVGPSRASPVFVATGLGPTGVAVHEGRDRLYVLNRIDHSITIARASTMTRLSDVALHDPSADATRAGRKFLYDAMDTSAHGDASCASCHLSGDMDGLAWDLGNPEGSFVDYDEPLDNVRFVIPQNGVPETCEGPFCADHDGFDPQKGPMVTQTLRGMLEPLHWRGDRATMASFNQAFVSLLGAADIGPIGGSPAGLSAEDMDLFREFALAIHFPPNPYRKIDDTTPCGPRATDPTCQVQPLGSLHAGNPTEGALLFDADGSDAGEPCVGCHAHPFGAAGGAMGGVTPTEPTSTATTGLFFGGAAGSPHNDLEVPHLRNIYDKFGPVWAAPAGSPPETKTGFGFSHDGSFPDLSHFLSQTQFSIDAVEVRDLAAFLFHFPTGTRPAVGRQVTMPAAGGSGSGAEETLLTTLVSLGDSTDVDRHCELVASTVSAGRARHYYLAAGQWVTDATGDPPVSLASLRASAEEPITFTCVTTGSGPRLGGDRDEDASRDADDCASADGETWMEPITVAGLVLAPDTVLTWSDQATETGPSLRYDVLGGDLGTLRASGPIAATSCLAGDLEAAGYVDPRPDPPPGAAHFFLVRARNPCGVATLGPGLEPLASLSCP